MTLGQLIDRLDDTREKKRKLNEEIKKLDAQYGELEEQIKERLAAEGMDKATGKKATVSLSEEVGFLPGRFVHTFSSKAFFDLFFQLAVLRVELLDLLVELALLFARVVESVDELSKRHVLLLFEYEL